MARGSRPGVRLSVEPMIGMLAAHNIETEYLSPTQQADIRKAKFNGFFTIGKADELACHVLKMHPFEVWGQEYEDKVWFDMHDIEMTSEREAA